jgi:prevent-host-death family protein
MTIHVGIYEARTDFSRLIALVESGEEDVMVTRHGKPVAHIVSPNAHVETPKELLEADARRAQRRLRLDAARRRARGAFVRKPASREEVLEWIRDSREDAWT